MWWHYQNDTFFKRDCSNYWYNVKVKVWTELFSGIECVSKYYPNYTITNQQIIIQDSLNDIYYFELGKMKTMWNVNIKRFYLMCLLRSSAFPPLPTNYGKKLPHFKGNGWEN